MPRKGSHVLSTSLRGPLTPAHGLFTPWRLVRTGLPVVRARSQAVRTGFHGPPTPAQGPLMPLRLPGHPAHDVKTREDRLKTRVCEVNSGRDEVQGHLRRRRSRLRGMTRRGKGRLEAGGPSERHGARGEGRRMDRLGEGNRG